MSLLLSNATQIPGIIAVFVALVNTLRCSDYLHPWPIFWIYKWLHPPPKLFVVATKAARGDALLRIASKHTVYICKRASRGSQPPLLFTAFHTNAVNKLRPWGIEGSKQTNWLTCHLALALALFTAGFRAEAGGFYCVSAKVRPSLCCHLYYLFVMMSDVLFGICGEMEQTVWRV